MDIGEPHQGRRFRLAVRPLAASVVLNIVAPAVTYRLAAPHFPANSLAPLMLSGLPVAVGLAAGLIRTRSMDYLALFAAENVIVDVAAALLAHDERQALLGRALENPILALLFAASLATSRPLVQRMARQLSTGNEPKAREAFDARSSLHAAVYRNLTWAWVLGLTVKGIGAAALALTLRAQTFLVLNPLWGLASDAALVAGALAYGAAAMRAGEDRPVQQTGFAA